MERQGIFVISLDFELFWGFAGWSEIQMNEYRPRIEGAVTALEKIIETLHRHQIKCTIGYVGGIQYKDINEFLEKAPIIKPTYKDIILSSYGLLTQLIRNGKIEKKLLFRPDIIEQLKQEPLVELGSHTFSHYYALEEGQTREQFKEDIETALAESRRIGINAVSIIFPRNQIPPDFYDICINAGFTHIRGNEESYLYKSEATPSKFNIKRGLRFLDSYINLSGHHTYREPRKEYMIDVTASRFFRPYNNALKLLEPMKIRRIKKDLLYAATHGEIYHLWWHPHNFGLNTEENMAQLEEICEYFDQLKRRYGMVTNFMKEIK